MPFNAGELVATIRGDRTQLTRDLAAARTDLGATGKAAEASATRIVQASNKSAASQKVVSAAAKDAAKAQTAAGQAGATAGAAAAAGAQKAAAGARQQATAAKGAGDAAASAGRQGKAAGDDTAKAAKRAQDALDKQRDAAHTLGLGLTAYGTAAVGAFALTIAKSSEFGSKMAQLQSLSGANTDQMLQEAEAAQTLGTAYGFSASKVADAEIELQKAGQGVSDQLNGGLKGALTLAASGQLDVADATSIAVTTLTQFRLGADKTAHVADLLAAGSDKALGSVKDLGDGLKQGGLVASQMGLSVEDTVGTLSAFAQAGLIGSDAGTSLKTMLLSLQSPSTQAQKYLDDLGISAYDTGGKFVGITNLAGQLQEKLKDKSQAERDAALSTIFGSDAIRSANVLYKEGASGIQDWIGKVNDAGFAEDQASGKLDSLNGDFTKLVAVLETDLVRAGQALDPVLRPILQTATGLAESLGEVPAPVLALGAATAGLTGTVALGTAAMILFLPKWLEFQRAARIVGASDMPVLSKAVRAGTATVTGFRGAARSAASFLGGPWGLALAAAGAAMAIYNKSVDDASAGTEAISAVAKRGATDIDDLLKIAARGQNQAQIFNKILDFNSGGDVENKVLSQFSDLIDKISGFQGDPIATFFGETTETQTLSNTLEKVGDSLSQLATTDAPAAAQSFVALAGKTDGSARSIQTLFGMTKTYTDGLEAAALGAGVLTGKENDAQRAAKLWAFAQQEAAGAGHDAADGASDAASGIDGVAGSAEDAKQQVKDLTDAINGLDGGQLDARAAARKFQAAIDDATQAIKDNGQTAIDHGRKLDISTEKGRANAQALDDIAQAGLDSAAAYVDAGGDAAGASKRIEDARKAFVKAAGPDGMGLTRKAAQKLADDLLGIPGSIPVNVDVGIGGVSAVDVELGKLQAKLNSLHVPNAAQIVKNARIGMAGGGGISGGIPGRDSVPILAMPGEHVLTVQDVGALGGQEGVYSFRRALHGYAKGGAVKAPKAGSQAAYDAEAAKIQAQIDRQEAAVKTLRARAKKADQEASKASDASASIYGKGTGDKKHAAAQKAREASKRAKDAAAAQKKAEDRLDALRDSLGKQQGRSETAADLRTSLSRGDVVDADNPLGAVDLAFSESRDSNLTAGQRKSLRNLAQAQNGSFVKLQAQAKDAATAVDSTTAALDNAKQATAAAEEAYNHQKTAVESATDAVNDATTAQANAASTLQGLRDQFSSVVSSVGQNIRGLFSLSNAIREDATLTTSISHNAGTGAQWDEMVTSTVAGGATVQSIRSEIDQKASTFASFAGQLQQLAAMGYSSDVVTDVANLGADAGAKVAAALLVAGSQDVAAINAGYSSIASSTAAAGTVVAQGQLGGQIDAAQRAVDVANANLATAQAQLKQAQDADLAQLRATQAAAQQAYDVAVANRDSINRQITSAQQAIVTAVQNSLSGSKKALGGISHDAAISGRPVLWAEAGEEAYIPLANDARRPRALAILNETAQRLGQTVVPQGTARRALGGISTSSSTSYGGDTHNWNGPIFGRPADIMDAARRDAAKQRARANSAARIGRVQP